MLKWGHLVETMLYAYVEHHLERVGESQVTSNSHIVHQSTKDNNITISIVSKHNLNTILLITRHTTHAYSIIKTITS